MPGNSEPLLIDRVTVKWVKGSEFGVIFDTLQLKVVERITTLSARLVKTRHDSVHEREETWAGIRSGAQ